MENEIQILLVALVLALWIVLMWKFLKNRLAPVKTVKAVVVDKHTTQSFTKYRGDGVTQRYCVVFEAEGKRLAFYVSRLSYDAYQIHEKGTLKYKGNRILDFS